MVSPALIVPMTKSVVNLYCLTDDVEVRNVPLVLFSFLIVVVVSDLNSSNVPIDLGIICVILFSQINVKPCFPQELLYAEGKIDTVMGEIYVRWQHQMNSVDVWVDVPFGAEAILTLPDGVRELKSGWHAFSFECENA